MAAGAAAAETAAEAAAAAVTSSGDADGDRRQMQVTIAFEQSSMEGKGLHKRTVGRGGRGGGAREGGKGGEIIIIREQIESGVRQVT